MNSKIKDPIKVASILKSRGFECYAVGGIVRDFIITKKFNEVAEWDFCTNAKPEEVIEIFKKEKVKVIPTGVKHGTVTVVYNGKNYEITTYRSEGNYSDSRHPDNVEFLSNIKEDLSRRDFTINAMALDIVSGEFIDLFGGVEDIKNKLIKTVGNPNDRFKEDALRLMRACRFAAKLEFKIEENTLEAIKTNAHNIKNVSYERIRDEIIKIMLAKKPSIGVEYMRITGLLEIVLPELLQGYGVTQNIYHKYDVYYHNLMTCDLIQKFLENETDPKRVYRLKIGALLHDIAKPLSKNTIIENGIEMSTFHNHEIIGAGMTRKILKRLRFSNEDIDWISRLVRHHMFYYTDEWTDAAVRRFIRNVGLDLIPDLFILREADRLGSGKRSQNSLSLEKLSKRIQKIIEEQNAISLKDLKVNGYDIMGHLNISPGPKVGKILNSLLQIVIDDPSKNEKEILLKLAEEIYTSLDNETHVKNLTTKKN